MRVLTNVASGRLSKTQVLLAYRLRWQIELFFEELKSYANLRQLCTRKNARAFGAWTTNHPASTGVALWDRPRPGLGTPPSP
jgi:hypothetical protein